MFEFSSHIEEVVWAAHTPYSGSVTSNSMAASCSGDLPILSRNGSQRTQIVQTPDTYRYTPYAPNPRSALAEREARARSAVGFLASGRLLCAVSRRVASQCATNHLFNGFVRTTRLGLVLLGGF